MTIQFAPIKLPKPTWRRSWLADRADARCTLFARLLIKLCPTVQIKPGRLGAYYQLLEHLETRFPVFVPEFDTYYDDPEVSPLDAAEEMGIPVDLFGRDYDDRSSDDHRVAIAALEWFMAYEHGQGHDGVDLRDFPALKMLMIQMQRFVDAKTDPKWMRLGRGYEWRPEWAALPDLVKYVTGETGSFFLDNNHLDIAESNGLYPRWTIGEIRAIEREWQRTRPRWESIVMLAKYIDEKALERVPVMLGVLSGDVKARAQVIRHKPKTLVEVWA